MAELQERGLSRDAIADEVGVKASTADGWAQVRRLPGPRAWAALSALADGDPPDERARRVALMAEREAAGLDLWTGQAFGP